MWSMCRTSLRASCYYRNEHIRKSALKGASGNISPPPHKISPLTLQWVWHLNYSHAPSLRSSAPSDLICLPRPRHNPLGFNKSVQYILTDQNRAFRSAVVKEIFLFSNFWFNLKVSFHVLPSARLWGSLKTRTTLLRRRRRTRWWPWSHLQAANTANASDSVCHIEKRTNKIKRNKKTKVYKLLHSYNRQNEHSLLQNYWHPL